MLPIVALTANAYTSDINECLGAGMVDHVSKPVSMAALGATVTRWLGHNGRSPLACPDGDGSKPSLASKFGHRKVTYGIRLAELLGELSVADLEERKRLTAEAQEIAHKLAGTAAMFGEKQLGDLAAHVEDNLKAGLENDSPKVEDLLHALQRAA